MLRWRVLAVTLLILFAFGQPVLAEGGEGGRVVFGDAYTLEAGQRLYGDLVVFGGAATVEEGAVVYGDAVTFGGSIRIAGRVEGDLITLGGAVDLQETAAISGKVTSTGGAIRDRRAQSAGRSEESAPTVEPPVVEVWRERSGSPFGLAWRRAANALADLFVWVLQTLAVIVTVVGVGVLLVALAPSLVETTAEALTEHPAACVGVGLLSAVLAAVAVPLLALICIGIPLALLLVVGFGLALLYGWIVVGLAVGERMLVALNRSAVRPLPAVALGTLLLTLLARLPGLGMLVAILIGAWGLGAALLTRFGTSRYAGRAII